MARHDDDRIEQAAKRLDACIGDAPHDEFATAAIHRLSQRVIELEATNTALLNALTRYRADHDQKRWQHDRPCDCQLCQQAEQAIKAAKGGT